MSRMPSPVVFLATPALADPGLHHHPHGVDLASVAALLVGVLGRGGLGAALGPQMIPGEIFPADGDLVLNEGAEVTVLMVADTGDRPVQVGSHYHFAETNPGLEFDRAAARGKRLDIAADGVRFELGQCAKCGSCPCRG